MSDFAHYMRSKEKTKRCYAEYNAASIALDSACMEERIAELLSQHEPAASIGIDREKMRQVLSYVRTGRIGNE